MTNDLKNELNLLADTEAPFSTVDIARARRDGRRRKLTGRLAAASTGVAVVAVCGLAVGGLAGGPGAQAASGGSDQAGTAPISKAAVSQNAAAFTGTDPLSSHASFGTLPAGWKAGSIEDGPDYGNSIEAYSGTDKANGPYANLQITDNQRTAESFDPYATSTPATVPGSPTAEYITVPARDKVYPAPYYGLQWKTSKGTWAALFVNHIGSQDASRALLDSLAAGVTVDSTAVPLPLHIDGVPADYPARSQELSSPGWLGKGFAVQLVFGAGDRQFSVTAEPSGPAPAPAPTTPVSGIPAPPLDPNQVKPDRACKDDNGLTVCVTGIPGVPDSVGGAKGFLDHITSLGIDQANWTTHVLS